MLLLFGRRDTASLPPRGRSGCHVRRANERRGATAIEFALVAPLIFLLFFGAIEIARLSFLHHTVENAAYEGARRAIVAGGTEENARQEAIRLLQAVQAGNGIGVDVEEQPDRVTVTVSLPVEQNSWSLGLFTSNFTLVGTCTLSRESIQQAP